ncbi:hypothetical protein T01_9967 [Trichinella spiralis]|uniref:Uncharacterized protein n=1 Tax=Trichinella spiralis TaxID=6334 RepID=A0A0V1BNZ1_TRISP|nr:hypothetical protein T01_9967 [Trichinella spiralis]
MKSNFKGALLWYRKLYAYNKNYAFNELISICQWLDYEALTIATSIKARRIAQHKLAAKIASCKRLRAQLCWQSGHFDQFNLTGNENVQRFTYNPLV